MRVKFKSGEQRKFLDLVISRLNCISLRGILERGFDVSYNSLKNYYTERRLLPQDFFKDLCYLAKINVNRLNVEYLEDNWGKVKGGENGKR
jgi:hypothetical protein